MLSQLVKVSLWLIVGVAVVIAVFNLGAVTFIEKVWNAPPEAQTLRQDSQKYVVALTGEMSDFKSHYTINGIGELDQDDVWSFNVKTFVLKNPHEFRTVSSIEGMAGVENLLKYIPGSDLVAGDISCYQKTVIDSEKGRIKRVSIIYNNRSKRVYIEASNYSSEGWS